MLQYVCIFLCVLQCACLQSISQHAVMELYKSVVVPSLLLTTNVLTSYTPAMITNKVVIWCGGYGIPAKAYNSYATRYFISYSSIYILIFLIYFLVSISSTLPGIDIRLLDTLDIQDGTSTIIEAYSNKIQQQLLQCKNKEIICIGHSLGGAAMLLATASSEIVVNKMILIDPVDTGFRIHFSHLNLFIHLLTYLLMKII